jgi:hypothetical protein
MEKKSEINESFGAFVKAELLVAVGEVDDWIDAGGRGQLKNSFTEPCKTELTTQQQTDLMNLTTNKRQGEF